MRGMGETRNVVVASGVVVKACVTVYTVAVLDAMIRAWPAPVPPVISKSQPLCVGAVEGSPPPDGVIVVLVADVVVCVVSAGVPNRQCSTVADPWKIATNGRSYPDSNSFWNVLRLNEMLRTWQCASTLTPPTCWMRRPEVSTRILANST